MLSFAPLTTYVKIRQTMILIAFNVKRTYSSSMQVNLFVLFITYFITLILGVEGNNIVTTQNSVLSTNEFDEDGAPNVIEKLKVTERCPNMFRHVFEGAAPNDEDRAGVFTEYIPEGVDNMNQEKYLWSCLRACCDKLSKNATCNVVLVFKQKCYHIQCATNEACLPKVQRRSTDKVQMVLVNPVIQSTTKNPSGEEPNSWSKILRSSKSMREIIPEETEILPDNDEQSVLNFWKQPRRLHYLERNQGESQAYDEEDFPIAEKRMKQLLMAPLDDSDVVNPDDISNFYGSSLASDPPKYITCDIELTELDNHCPQKEECIPLQENALTGVCSCIHGYVRNKLQRCVPNGLDFNVLNREQHDDLKESPNRMLISAASVPLATEIEGHSVAATLPIKTENVDKNIVVSVVSKEVRLPEKEVTLAAFTVPASDGDSKYKYLWTLISQPKGPMNGTISDQSKSKVKLSNLSEGLYTFKVTVTDENGSLGSAMANVTVLPEKRINKVPQVVITPNEQIIRQPTTNAVLDGSTSTDDDKIINWHWEVISGPIGYQPKLPEVATLQLTDLTSPGNYTLKLTVTDSNNVTNSTTATIAVLKETDFPPVANAGDAVILYLPNNNVTLNGTASSDDHEIVAWEWTKDASDEAKAVDMQNTRTPYVQLSNLEEGMYTFVLKVTDGSNQSSTAKVHVFVKPPTNSPPVASAGTNTTTSLPRNWVILNGSESKDDIGITSFQWRQLSGPNMAVIINSNASLANATQLTLGLYEFELDVTDANNNTDSTSTWVKIVQERNAAPIANAGGDHSITLPVTAMYLNGSQSWDDLAVVKYSWTREDNSLAAGTIVANTDKEAVMILSNLVQGRYVFKLQVSDEQGLTSTDTVSINVHPDPMLMHLLQMTLPMGISVLSQSELNLIVQKINLLLGDDMMKVIVREVKYDLQSEAAVLVFYVETVNGNGQAQPINGLQVEHWLKEKLARDASILGALFVDIRTTICQNMCSGHGVCNPSTRACICEAFWMPSFGYFFGWRDANCDWSILYVFVGVIVSCLLLSGIFWGIACACRQSKKPRSRQKVQKYSLIGTQDEEAANYSRTTSLTESDTDSDVLFETRTKSNGILRMNGTTNGKHKNGTQNSSQNNKYNSSKMGRKIKA